MKRLGIVFSMALLAVGAALGQTCVPQSSAPGLATLDSCGKLQYSTYLNRVDANPTNLNRIPDFSFAGYRRGGRPIPQVPEMVRVPRMTGDATSAIQAAIDQVSALPLNAAGYRGAVVLDSGGYRIDQTLRIRTSGVVLRGQGQHPLGTQLLAGARRQYTVVSIQGVRESTFEDTTTRITSPFVGVGSTALTVENAGAFNVGDTVHVMKTPNAQWISAIGMDQLTTMPGATADVVNWDPASYATKQERTVVSKNGNELRFDFPLIDSIYASFGGGVVKKIDVGARVFEAGVEDLRIVAGYTSETDEAHAWTAVSLSAAHDSWVRRVTAQNFGLSVVDVNHSSFVTVEDCAGLHPVSRITGGRRYAFNVDGTGVGVLFQRVFSDSGRHSFVTGATVTGPHVWVDSLAINAKSDEGPHQRWGAGLLYDSLKTSTISIQNRGPTGTGQGWSGAQVMLWRTITGRYVLQAAPTSMTWAVGVQGSAGAGSPSSTKGYGLTFTATQAQPRSLYYQQLQDRLGAAAVATVTNAIQRAGRSTVLIDLLTRAPATGADPKCASGTRSGTVCCAASCGGVCGGAGCSNRPGGAAACCTSVIEAAGKSCLEGGAPCNIAPVPAYAYETVIADPMCHRGVASGSICCAASCGSCGGANCAGRPGGAAGCCGATIQGSQKSCDRVEAPCVMSN